MINFVGSAEEECSSVVDKQRRQHRASAWIQVLPPSSFGASIVRCTEFTQNHKSCIYQVEQITC